MSKLKLIGYNVIVLVTLLFLAEVGLRVIQPEREVYRRIFVSDSTYAKGFGEKDKVWVKDDPDLGWVHQSHSTPSLFVAPEFRDIQYTINNQGFRSAFDFRDSVTNKKKVMLIGDSFLFGMYLEEGKTITNKLDVLSDSTHIFYNVSVPGWGIDQMFIAYLKYVEIIKPDIVILLYIDDDMMRNLHAQRSIGRKKRFRIEKESLVEDDRPPNALERFCWTNQISNRLYTRYLQWYSVQLTKVMFTKIIESEQAYNRESYFIHAPLENHVLEEDTQILFDLEDYVVSEDGNFLQLYDSLVQLSDEQIRSHYIPDDGHFSEKGTDLVSKLIYSEILDP